MNTGTAMTKTCTKCGETKGVECFSSRADHPHLRYSRCNACRAADQRQRRAANPGYDKGYNLKWRSANPDYQRLWQQRRAAAEPWRAAEAKRKQRAENPEKTRAYDRNRYRTKRVAELHATVAAIGGPAIL